MWLHRDLSENLSAVGWIEDDINLQWRSTDLAEQFEDRFLGPGIAESRPRTAPQGTVSRAAGRVVAAFHLFLWAYSRLTAARTRRPRPDPRTDRGTHRVRGVIRHGKSQ